VTDLAIAGAGVRLAAEEAGEGPAVVLLHGLTATRRYVVMGSRALERGGHRVIAYDARGHGASDPAPDPEAYGYADLAADLLAVLDDRGLEQAVLAGASMGAHTLLAFALAYPERVAGLVVITPAFDPEDTDPARLERWDRLSRGLREGGVEGFLAAYGEPTVDEAFRASVKTVVRQRLSQHEHPEALADALRVTPRSAPFAAWADLHALDVPAAVVASRDAADPEHPLALGRRYGRELPGAEVHTEAPGKSPLAWQGSQLSRIIAAVAARSAAAP
jgi:pimeloyl-ACP methyl ester carboxylesterase